VVWARRQGAGTLRAVPVLLKYALMQLPGLALAAGVLWLASEWGWLSRGAALALLGVWAAKDAAMYPLLRHAYGGAPSRHLGSERLVGQFGVAQEVLAPTGYVRVAGELWRAECTRPGVRIEPQGRVHVHAVRGLTLLVTPGEQTPPAGGC